MKRRGIALLMMICVISLLSIYVSSVRATGQQAPPCDQQAGNFGTGWKWGFCHNGHPVCTGDANEVRNLVGHETHGTNNPDNPPRGCYFAGCCLSDDDVDCSTPPPPPPCKY